MSAKKQNQQENRRGFGGGANFGMPAQKAKNFKGTFKRFLAYLKPHSTSLIAVFMLAILGTGFAIAGPKIAGQAMNKLKDGYIARESIPQMTAQQMEIVKKINSQMKESSKLADSKEAKVAKEFMELPMLDTVKSADEKAKVCEKIIDLSSKMEQGQTVQGKQMKKDQIDTTIKAIKDTNGKIDFDYIGQIIFLLIGLYALSWVFTSLSAIIMSGVAQKTVYDMRSAVNLKLDELPLKYFDGKSHGDVLSRVTNDIDTISTTLQQSLTQFVTSIVQIIGFVIMMLIISPLLTLIVLATLPLYVVTTAFIAKKSQKYFSAQQKEIGELSGHVEEMYAGHKIVKVFGREQQAIEKFDAINKRLYEEGWKAQFISGIIFPLMGFISNLGYVLISVVGGLWMTKGTLNIGDIAAFIQYSRQFTMPIIQTASIANVVQSTIACAERVFEVLDEQEEVEESDTKVIDNPKGEVRFENVSFRYKEDVPLIDNMNIDVKQGNTIAIVGPTGAGKTTLVNLLMRFYEIREGKVIIDGVDIKDMKREYLRSMFGMVLQDTWLFNGTIRDNIAYGRAGATEADIRKVAKAAHADHFIRTLPKGYDTVLNEEGTNISQGQKQLLTIARAILADPKILILDEATSSVDTRTEVLIQKAMENLMNGRTSFVIAHRLSTIRDAKTILVMDKGTIVEQGNHKQLLAKGGFYSELYNA